jgi:putative transcriptional regulator
MRRSWRRLRNGHATKHEQNAYYRQLRQTYASDDGEGGSGSRHERPDAQPFTADQLARMKHTPRAKLIRRAFGLTQEEFAAQFQIPLGTLRDWEQGVAEPDQAARAYLRVIASDPDAVRKALQPRPRPPR